MEGMLSLVVIIIYAELSLCPITRSIGQTLFYTHTLAIITPMYAPTADVGLIQAGMIYLIGCAFCAVFSDTISGKIIFWFIGLLSALIYFSVLMRVTLDLTVFGFNVGYNTDTILRWSILTALGTCSKALNHNNAAKLRDIQLAIVSVFIMMLFG